MSSNHSLILLLVLGLLTACDDKPAPSDPVPSPPSAPEVRALPPAPVAPVTAQQKAEPAPSAQETAKPAEAMPKQAPSVLPAPGSQVIKDTSLAKPSASQAKPAAQVSTRQPLPPAKLDLRLPPDMLEQLQPEENVEIDFSKPPLLPEMFVERPKEPGPFELNGRLITNDHSKEDYWDSVEGAELQFKFRN